LSEVTSRHVLETRDTPKSYENQGIENGRSRHSVDYAQKPACGGTGLVAGCDSNASNASRFHGAAGYFPWKRAGDIERLDFLCVYIASGENPYGGLMSPVD
jgi:hypothetical protein